MKLQVAAYDRTYMSVEALLAVLIPMKGSSFSMFSFVYLFSNLRFITAKDSGRKGFWPVGLVSHFPLPAYPQFRSVKIFK